MFTWPRISLQRLRASETYNGICVNPTFLRYDKRLIRTFIAKRVVDMTVLRKTLNDVFLKDK
jgi:hypothetical protein